MMKSPLLPLCFLLSAVVSAQTEVLLDVSGDSWIAGLSSTETHGSSDRLGICPLAQYWIYLKFDLSTVEGEITDATLEMSRFQGSRPDEISVYGAEDAWSEVSLNGPNRPEPVMPDNSSSLVAAGAEGLGPDTWSSPQLTAFLNQERTGDGTATLMVRENPADMIDVRYYFSRDAGGSGDPPRLRLTVAAPVTEQIGVGWIVGEAGEGVKPSFDFHDDGTMEVMAMTEATGGFARLYRSTSPDPREPWTTLPIDTGYFYGPGDLRVAADGTVHLAWHNHTLQNPAHARVEPGGTVTVFDLMTPGHDGWDNALAISSGGVLHMSAVDPSAFGAMHALQHGTLDGDTWTFGTIEASESFMYGLNTSVAIDAEGFAHIAFCNGMNWFSASALRYAHQTETGWEFETVESAGIAGHFPSLALDHWDRPHIAWINIDESDNSIGTVRYGVKNAGVWEIETVDVLDDVVQGFSGTRKAVSLALDTQYRPHLAYGDTEEIRYAVMPFAEWQIEPVLTDSTTRPYNGLVVLRIDADGLPGIVTWQTATAGGGRVRMVKKAAETFEGVGLH